MAEIKSYKEDIQKLSTIDLVDRFFTMYMLIAANPIFYQPIPERVIEDILKEYQLFDDITAFIEDTRIAYNSDALRLLYDKTAKFVLDNKVKKRNIDSPDLLLLYKIQILV